MNVNIQTDRTFYEKIIVDISDNVLKLALNQCRFASPAYSLQGIHSRVFTTPLNLIIRPYYANK